MIELFEKTAKYYDTLNKKIEITTTSGRGFYMVWGKIVLFVVAIFVLMFIFNTVMAKVLKVEKRSLFFNNHVNELHKKWGDIKYNVPRCIHRFKHEAV